MTNSANSRLGCRTEPVVFVGFVPFGMTIPQSPRLPAVNVNN